MHLDSIAERESTQPESSSHINSASSSQSEDSDGPADGCNSGNVASRLDV